MVRPGEDGPSRNLFEAFADTDRTETSGAGQDLLGMLRTVGGASSRTRSGIDLTKVAQRMKVSRRTVERWARAGETGQGQRPSAEHFKGLTRRSRQASTTQRGRKATVRNSGLRGSFSAGASVTIKANQGPTAAGKEYRRLRTTNQDLDPEEAQAMIDAWEQGGEKGFLAWASNRWDSGYLEGWGFDSSEGISIDIQQPPAGLGR